MVDIDFLYKSGFISSLDYYFAKILCRTAQEEDPVMLLSAALTSMASLNGNVCLNLDEYAGKPVSGSEFSPLKFPSKYQWMQSIENSRITGTSIEFPLVSDGKSRLYLARYYDFQQRIVENILKRTKEKSDDIDIKVLDQGLDRIFPGAGKNHQVRAPEGKNGDNRAHGIRLQRKAAMNAVLKNFSIITGGPGTGKTFICEKIIELLNDQAEAASMHPLRIMTAAPTGKAASKLTRGSTIHRMLGTTNQANKFRHNKNAPIPCDVVIIDEASMIDIALAARLLEAVPDTARLIILGDKNQLASVEAGTVFGDICRSKMTADAVTHLEYNFRSGGNSGIDRLAKAVNRGDAAEVENLLLNKNFGDICFIEINDDGNNGHEADLMALQHPLNKYRNSDFKETVQEFHIKNTQEHQTNGNQIFHDSNSTGIPQEMVDKIIKGYLPFIDETDPGKALEKFDMFRILCAHKKGHYGTEFFNTFTENFLYLQREKKFHSKSIIDKKPVMVNINDYHKKLFNGDTGIAVRLKDDTIRVYFKDENRDEREENADNSKKNMRDRASPGLKSFPLSDLPSHEDAFAMTVHKSQGSEFDHVLFVLPARLSPVVTRELLYTGITRAKKNITIAGTMDVIKEAVSLPVHRSSAITELIDQAVG